MITGGVSIYRNRRPRRNCRRIGRLKKYDMGELRQAHLKPQERMKNVTDTESWTFGGELYTADYLFSSRFSPQRPSRPSLRHFVGIFWTDVRHLRYGNRCVNYGQKYDINSGQQYIVNLGRI